MERSRGEREYKDQLILPSPPRWPTKTFFMANRIRLSRRTSKVVQMYEFHKSFSRVILGVLFRAG